ncbi:MAG: tryptophan-rich sensory protein [bacterium]|nr:tryptophan-rich sensory protein [bacterium]
MNNSYNWYSTLIKPTWAPPSFLFGPVWTVLYAIIAYTFGTVFWKFYKGELTFIVVLPFILNLIFNFSFTYFQFGLKNNLLASVDILLVFITLIWLLIVIYPHMKWVTYMNIPYLLWVSFATVLQLTITYLNSKTIS